MFQRIKILTLLQLGNKIKISKIIDKKKFALNILFSALLIVGITVGFYFVLNLIKNFLFLPVNKGTLTFLLYVSQFIGIVVCTSSLMKSLYDSKDNPILLSYPARHNEVFLSKLVVAYLQEFRKNLYFILPLFLSFGILSGLGVLYFSMTILSLLFLPVFTVCIGALISLPLMYLKRLLDRIPLSYLVIVIVLVALMFYVLNLAISVLPRPLRIISIYTKFVNEISNFIVSANKYALFYAFISDIFYGINFFLNMLWIVLIAGGLIALVFYVSMPIYFKLASKSGERANKIHKNAKNSKPKNTFWAFARKEFLFTVRNTGDVIKNYALIIVMPIVLYVFNFVLGTISLSNFGNNLVSTFTLIIGLILITASNTQSASAISVEGSEFVLVKTAPSKTANMAWAKIFVNLILSTILILISWLICGLSEFVIMRDLWQIFVVMILINGGHILWSFQLDVVHPYLRDYGETGHLEDNKNVKMSVTLGFIISLLVGFIAIFLMMDNLANAWTKILLIAVAFFLFRLFLFIKNLKVYFKRIEY